jgi:hypothetical protein
VLQRDIQKNMNVGGERKPGEEQIMDDALEKRWQELSEELRSQMKAWRQIHPKATVRSSEHVVRKRLSYVQTHMLHDMALPSEIPQPGSGRSPLSGVRDAAAKAREADQKRRGEGDPLRT